MTFKELYLSGQVPFEEIDRYISRWNRSDDERTLAKYLGLNADEEDVWIDRFRQPAPLFRTLIVPHGAAVCIAPTI